MNKTVTINLGGIIFNIEEAAYDRLKRYLDSIKAHYAEQTGNEEIIGDIEARAAEEFSTKISKAKQVIVPGDVDDLIATLGTVEDITEEKDDYAPGDEKAKTEVRNKKLFRDSDDVVIAGVCSGIASFFGLDPVIVRLLFVASIFFGGFGIPLYIILWIVMPEAKTTTEKMQMRGETITLSALEDAVKKNFKTKPGEQNKVMRALTLPIRFIGQVFALLGKALRRIIPILSALLGLFAGFIFLLGFGSCLFIFANLLFNANSPYINFPLGNVIGGNLYYGAIVSAMFVAIIPLFFILIVGISLIRRKMSFGLMSSLSMILLWIIAIISLSVIGIKAAPQIERYQSERQGKNVTQTIQGLPSFAGISTRGNQKIKITKGDNISVVAKGQESAINAMKFEVVDGVLKIKKENRDKICIFCNETWTPIEIDITMPKLSSYASGESVETDIKGFSEDKIRLEAYNGSDLTADVQASSTEIEMDGYSTMILKGTSTKMNAQLESSAYLKSYDYAVDQADLDLTDSSKAEVNAKNITHKTSDRSKIFYKGEPKITNAKKTEKVLQEEKSSDNSEENRIIDETVIE